MTRDRWAPFNPYFYVPKYLSSDALPAPEIFVIVYFLKMLIFPKLRLPKFFCWIYPLIIIIPYSMLLWTNFKIFFRLSIHSGGWAGGGRLLRPKINTANAIKHFYMFFGDPHFSFNSYARSLAKHRKRLQQILQNDTQITDVVNPLKFCENRT